MSDSMNLEEVVLSLRERVAELEFQEELAANVVARKMESDSGFSDGDTAWMLTSCALVLFMTIPGLAIFYAGLAEGTSKKFTVVLHCFVITALITFLWLCFGYSLALAPSNHDGTAFRLYGDASRFWLSGLELDTSHQNAPTIPESVYCMYQLTFAIITPCLITGAFANKIRFRSMIVYMILWHFLVYCPIAHSLWHPSGFLNYYGALDYAGGNVVHISAGISAAVIAYFLGASSTDQAPAQEPEESKLMFTLIGAAMLWVGWFGFNAGSAGAASGRAGMAMLATQISTAMSVLSWMTTEWFNSTDGRITIQGVVSGAVSGLVAVTPAAGYIDHTGAFFIGLIAGPWCYYGCRLKSNLKFEVFGFSINLNFEDALDAFGVHASAGVIGGILTGFFATSAVDGRANGVFYTDTFHGGRQLGIQLYAIVFTIAWTLVFSTLISLIVDYTMGLRLSETDIFLLHEPFRFEAPRGNFSAEVKDNDTDQDIEERQDPPVPHQAPSNTVELERHRYQVLEIPL